MKSSEDFTTSPIPSVEIKERIIEAIVDSTISMISVVDKSLRIVMFNQKMEEYSGSTKRAALGKQFFDVFPHLKHEDFESAFVKAWSGETVHIETTRSEFQKGRYFETFFI